MDAYNPKMAATIDSDEALRLLRRIDAHIDVLHEKLDDMPKTAAKYGAVAGGVTGGLVSVGIAFAKAKLGL